MQCSDINIRLAKTHSPGLSTASEIGVYQRTDILIAPVALAPQLKQLVKYSAWHLEGTPDPYEPSIALFNLHLKYTPGLIRHHGIEEFGPRDREEQKREDMVIKRAKPIFRKPN